MCIKQFTINIFRGLLGWGSRGSHEIIYVRAFVASQSALDRVTHQYKLLKVVSCGGAKGLLLGRHACRTKLPPKNF